MKATLFSLLTFFLPPYLRAVLEVNGLLDRGVDAQIHLGLFGYERAPAVAALAQVLRQAARVRVVPGGEKLRLRGPARVERGRDLFLLREVVPGVLHVEEHRFERVRVVAHALDEVLAQVGRGVLLA